ncbi:MAG: 30S ribosomal protein S9, partial [Pseudonocardiales bacterium]|nr:30S ribosomal protein S9 [Pseudonocardiales bacterium]
MTSPETDATVEPVEDEAVEVVADEDAVDKVAPEDFEVEVEVGGEGEVAPAVFSDRPVQTVGRRKEAVVRVRLMPGSGNFTLNGKSLETYF